jgi:serine/threonine-protein kinase
VEYGTVKMSGYFEGLIGTRLGGYVVRRMIARGGMGVVYEGYQESLDSPLAIKILYPHKIDDVAFSDRFQREARALAQLNHPNIVRVIDFGVSEQYVYMIMELIDGHSLRDELIGFRERGEVMDIVRSMEILQAVGGALTFAHERGFVHRDVKPGNILIDRNNNEVFLTDFGLVKLEDVAGATATGAVMGTPEYMAPEQFLATSAAGPAADQYALAVVAFEMLTGRVPFQAPTPVGLLHKHLEEEPPSISTIDAKLPHTVEPVIRRGLAKDPNTRYPTVTGFVNELQESTTVQLPTIASASTLAEPPFVDSHRAEAAATPQPARPAAVAAPVAAPARPAPASAAAGGGSVPPRTAMPTAESSRPGWLKWVLIGVIPLLIIGAVGATMLGGGDDDNPDPTATILAVIDPTTTSSTNGEPTATTNSGPAPTATLAEATATTAVQPTSTLESTPTTQPAEPTSTRAPIVVTRVVRSTPTPGGGLISIPTPATDDNGYTSLVSSDFVEGEDTSIWVVSTDRPEFTTQIIDGNYVVDILSADPNGYSVFSYPQGATDLGDGAVAINVRIAGDGSAGIMMRRTENADGTSSMYECHVANTQDFSCWKQVNDSWTEIVPLQHSDAIVANEYNTVIVAATGTSFALQINDVDVASWTDDSLSTGQWGVYVERNAGGASMAAYYDAVVIVQN